MISPPQAVAGEYDGLSERELEVAALIGQGKSNAEIAELLVVSKRTVETYVSSVLSKLGLSSRSQIALWARDKGLASREPYRGNRSLSSSPDWLAQLKCERERTSSICLAKLPSSSILCAG